MRKSPFRGPACGRGTAEDPDLQIAGRPHGVGQGTGVLGELPGAQLLEETLKLAARIAEKSPLALKFLKTSMLQGADMPLPAALAYEAAAISLVFDSEDAHEGCSAFIEKRKPVFNGR